MEQSLMKQNRCLQLIQKKVSKVIPKSTNDFKFTVQNKEMIVNGSKISKRPFERIGGKSMTKNIGIKVNEPKRECMDKNCPFHGGLSIRGKLFDGKVTGDKAKQTITLTKDEPDLL